MQKGILLALGYAVLLIGCSGVSNGVDEDTTGASNGVDEDTTGASNGVDEGLTGVTKTALTSYTDYQSATAGRVEFAVSSLKRGNLTDIASRPVNDLIGVPDYSVRMQQRGTDIIDVVREPRNLAIDEWSHDIDLHRFDQIGRPLAEGTYDLLSVRMTLDGEVSEHKALEVCWAAQDYCIVMDPVVQQLSSFVESRRNLLAAGWKVNAVPTSEFASHPSGAAASSTVCSLNSRPTAGGITFTWSAYSVSYKDVFGITLVSKSLGAQQTGISCFISNGACRSSGNGFSSSSSCSATLGYNCNCSNSGNVAGSTQPQTRDWAETKCTHAFAGNTSISFSFKGTGASLSLVWNTNGSVDSNGGQAFDACSFHTI